MTMPALAQPPADVPANQNRAGPLSLFKIRKFSLYFSGQLVSQVGTWMQQVALSWLAYKMTGSPFMLAVVGVSAQLPSLVLMPIAGVFVDRLNRHKLLLITQILAMVEATILTALTLTHSIQVWHLVALGIFAGIVTAFDMPTRSAFVVDLVEERSQLPSVIGLNSALMNITRLVGPAMAGFIVAAAGEGVCFLINAVSYIFVIGALLMIRGNFTPRASSGKDVWVELKEGFSYAVNTGPIRGLIILLALSGLGGMAYAMLLPVYVKQIHGDANTLGYLMAASAAGSLCASLALASKKSVLGLGKWVVASSILFAVALIIFSQTNSLIPAMLSLAFVGAMMMLQMGSSSTILQSIVEEDKRGRVMSLFTLAFLGTAPIGSLVVGAIADKVGFSQAILGCGIYCLIIAVGFATQMPRLRKEAQPIYVQRGLLEAEEEVDLLTR